jgi:hypothetical protein
MKYLKKIFENESLDSDDQFMSRHSITSDKKINVIEAYNDRLLNDKIWQEHYKDFLNWRKDYEDKRSFEYLEELIEIAEKRIKEIKTEFQNNIDLINDLYLNYLEDCKSFSDYSIIIKSGDVSDDSEYGYYIELTLIFSNETLNNRKIGQPVGFKLTSDEIMDYWKAIYEFFTVLESNNYTPRITNYNTKGEEMKILIGKNEN